MKQQESFNHPLKFVNIADHDLRRKTVLSSDAVRLDNYGRANEHLRQPLHFSGYGAHPNMGRDDKTEGGEIARNDTIPDRAHVLQHVGTISKLGLEHRIFAASSRTVMRSFSANAVIIARSVASSCRVSVVRTINL